MDASRGIHALLTFAFTLIAVFSSYRYATSFFASAPDSTLTTIYWISYILLIIVTAVAVPFIIATQNDSEASILSAALAWAYWIGGLFIVSVATPIAYAISNIINAILDIQLISVLWLIVVAGALFIGPLWIGTAPNMTSR